MTMESPTRTTWRDSPVTRVFGSALGWFSGALAITLLFQVASALSALGGYCARGGPYVVAVECTDAIAIFAPTSVMGGLVLIFIGTSLARGFGTSLLAFAWPALFVSLSVTFFSSFFSRGDLTGLFIGIMFFVMGLVPLVLMLRVAPQRTLLGRVDARGEAFWEAHPAQAHIFSLRRPDAPGENHPSAGDWVLALGIAVVASLGGVAVGVGWFAAVATG